MHLRSLLACLSLSACSGVVPSTAARLAAVDPLTADPGAIELVVILPPGLSVTPGIATLEISATRGADSRSGRFALTDIPAPPSMAVPEGASARVHRLTDAEAERMRQLQAEIAQWQQSGRARGSIGLGIGGCALGTGPALDGVGSVLIRIAEGGAFLPLVRDGRLSDLLGPEVLAAIEPCKGAE